MNQSIDKELITRSLTSARALLIAVADDPALWNARCDRANQNANNALALVVVALRSLGVELPEFVSLEEVLSKSKPDQTPPTSEAQQ